MRNRSLLAALVAILGLWTAASGPAQAALQLQGYDPARHDRFYVGVDKDFVGDPYDWSGVARRTDSTNHWVTMVSPSYFVSANHWHLEPGATLRFFHGNDPSGPFEDRTVLSGVRISTTDIWLGQLAIPVSTQVAHYPIPADRRKKRSFEVR